MDEAKRKAAAELDDAGRKLADAYAAKSGIPEAEAAYRAAADRARAAGLTDGADAEQFADVLDDTGE